MTFGSYFVGGRFKGGGGTLDIYFFDGPVSADGHSCGGDPNPNGGFSLPLPSSAGWTAASGSVNVPIGTQCIQFGIAGSMEYFDQIYLSLSNGY